jgi:hypothetical protein
LNDLAVLVGQPGRHRRRRLHDPIADAGGGEQLGPGYRCGIAVDEHIVNELVDVGVQPPGGTDPGAAVARPRCGRRGVPFNQFEGFVDPR